LHIQRPETRQYGATGAATKSLRFIRAPLPELIFRAQTFHRQFHAADRVQTCQLISIKTGGCPEDCAYCPQSAHYDADVNAKACWTRNTSFWWLAKPLDAE